MGSSKKELFAKQLEAISTSRWQELRDNQKKKLSKDKEPSNNINHISDQKKKGEVIEKKASFNQAEVTPTKTLPKVKISTETNEPKKNERPTIHEKVVSHPKTKKPIRDTIETQITPIRDTELQTTENKGHIHTSKRDTIGTHTETQKFKRRGRKKRTSCTFHHLSGNAKKLLIAIYQQCVFKQSYESDFIEKTHLAEISGVKISSIKTTIYRLRSYGLLEFNSATHGRGSMWKFGISKTAYDDISIYMSSISKGTIRDTHRDTIMPSSSSVLNNNITTTKLPPDWLKINFSHLSKVLDNYGEIFSHRQLTSIFNAMVKPLTAKDIQISIDRFTFGLSNYPDEKKYKRNVRVGSLIESLKSGELWLEFRYISPEEKPLFGVFEKMYKKFNLELSDNFNQWINDDKERKYKYYESQVGTTHFFDERVFRENAMKDYMAKVFPKRRRKYIEELMGEENGDLLNRFERIMEYQ